jgi:hypothetical protein
MLKEIHLAGSVRTPFGGGFVGGGMGMAMANELT